jgi:hypothetical protein
VIIMKETIDVETLEMAIGPSALMAQVPQKS